MADPIYKINRESNTGEQVTLDLSDMKPLGDLEKDFLREPSFLREESNRGTIGKMAVMMIATIVVLLPVIGGLIAAFKSVDQAQAYTTAVVTLLEAVGRFASIMIWPVMGYYFLVYAKK